jgi:hypothetical protein
MYEQYLSTFEFDPQPNIQHCVVKITQEPYAGTRVVLAKRMSLIGNKFKFDYEFLDNPHRLSLEDQAFVNVLFNIIVALMERGSSIGETPMNGDGNT